MKKIDPKVFEQCIPLDRNDRFILTCKHVADDKQPVLEVTRGKDFRGKPYYECICSPSRFHSPEEVMFVCPECMSKTDPTLATVPSLEEGDSAVRANVSSPWVVITKKPDPPFTEAVGYASPTRYAALDPKGITNS